MFFLTGVARYLFVPLAEAVVFAMLASYVLSRTLVPTLVMWFYRNVKLHGEHMSTNPASPFWLRPFVPIPDVFRNAASTGFAWLSGAAGERALSIAGAFVAAFLAFCAARCCCCRCWARTFSPASTPASSGCTCAPAPARASRKPQRLTDQVERVIRREIPPDELERHSRQHRHPEFLASI